MSKRKVVALALLWVLILILQGYWFFESDRLTKAAEAERAEQAARGAELYAANCMACHGPVGEGITGPPLNRSEFRAEGLTPVQIAATQEQLTKVIARGRPGFDHPTWRAEDGKIHSYTRMPTWSVEDNGPLNQQEIRDLVTFIMYGDWKLPGKVLAEHPELTRTKVTEYVTNPDTGQQEQKERPVTADDLDVEAKGLTAEENRRAKELFVKNCLACHTLGSYGGVIGPNLTQAGNWLPSLEFTKRWIANPQSFKPEERMPTVWHGQGTPVDLTETYQKEADKLQSQMPPFGEQLSEAEIDLLARFLMGLGTEEGGQAQGGSAAGTSGAGGS
ncbi:MAG TPA: c-type cytochrome [Thermaerobacter sp.]